jgi:hypothetical protein
MQIPRDVRALAIASRRKPIGTSFGKHDDKVGTLDEPSEGLLENLKLSFQEAVLGIAAKKNMKLAKIETILLLVDRCPIVQ